MAPYAFGLVLLAAGGPAFAAGGKAPAVPKSSSPACAFHDVVPLMSLTASSTTVFETRGYRLSLDGFNLDKSRPAWEGWLRVGRGPGKGECVIEESIIAGLHLDETGEFALVSAASGSDSWARLYRLRDCKALTEDMHAVGWDDASKRLVRPPSCYDDRCTRGLRYDLNASCLPAVNQKDSDAWTQEVYGVLISSDSLTVPPDSPLIQRSNAYWDGVNKRRK